MKPKILLLAPAYYPSIGGVEKHIQKVATELKRDFEVVILVRQSQSTPRRQVVDGVAVWRLPAKPSFARLLFWSLTHPGVLRGAQAIHSHDLYISALRRLLPRAKLIHTFHGFESYPISEDAIRIRQEIRREVPVCFCVGAFIEKWYGTKCDHVLYGATDERPAKMTKQSWDVLYVGRLEADTGFQAYLEALLAIGSVAKPRVAVAGNGSLMAWAKEFATANELDIQFMGSVEDVMSLMVQSRVVFTSGYLGILESASCSVPVVAFYDNELKKDYLEMHPQAKNLYIVKTPGEIAGAYEKALTATGIDLDQLAGWAADQKWSTIAKAYARYY